MLIAERIAGSIVTLYRAVGPQYSYYTCRFDTACPQYFQLSKPKYSLVRDVS